MSRTNDIVRLARIDAITWEDSRYAYVKHTYYGWRAKVGEEFVWRRTFKPIGQGGFGQVFREECMKEGRTGDVRAVKVLHRPTASTKGKIDIGRELEAVARFSRPEYARWFVRSSGWFESGDDIFIAMELIPYGNLQQYIGQGLPENEVKVVIAQVLKGLHCMHAAGYTHRDLKPPNLLVAQKGPAWHVKIADFGLSKRIAEDLSSLHTNAGTPGYVAPEVLGLQIDDAEDASRPSYTNAVDIWAIGVIAFVLLTGGLPFPSQDQRALARYARGQAPFPADLLRAKNISAAGCAFIESLMAPNPLMRPSAQSSADNVWLGGSKAAVTRVTEAHTSPGRSLGKSIPGGSRSWATKDSGYQSTTVIPHRSKPIAVNDGAPQSDQPKCINLSEGTQYKADQWIALESRMAFQGWVLAYAPRPTGERNRASPAGAILIRDLTSAVILATVDTQGLISRLALSADLQLLAFAPTEGRRVWEDGRREEEAIVHIWSISRGHIMRTLVQDDGLVRSLAFSPDGQQVALAGYHGAKLFDVRTGALLWRSSSNAVSDRVVFSSSGQFVAVTFTTYIALLDSRTGREIARQDCEEGYTFAISSNARYIGALERSRDRSPEWRMQIWDRTRGTKKTIDGPMDGLLVFSPDARYVASNAGESQMNSHVAIWEVSSGRKVQRLDMPKGTDAQDASFSPDGRHVIVATNRGTALVWRRDGV